MAATQGPHAVHGAVSESAVPESTGAGSAVARSTGARSRELGQLDWLPLTDDELRGILGRGDPGGLGREPVVTWRSPRPMSAAALVRHGDTAVFVKRHHLGVRAPGQLTAEHAFAGHLRERGLPVPAVLRFSDGEPVLRRGEYCYEVHQVAAGIDLYREAPPGRRTRAWGTPTRPAPPWAACTWPRRISASRPGRPRC